MRAMLGFLIAFGLGLIGYAVWEFGAGPAALSQSALTIKTEGGLVRFTVEMAITKEQQERGLMFRKSLAPDAGMMFDLAVEKRVSLWMKDTPIPLDMIFMKANGTIVQIAENAEPFSLRIIPSHEPVRAVLEIAGGRAAELGLKPGDLAMHAVFGNTPP